MTRLLAVDDSPLMRRLLTRIFSAEEDFEVFVARSGEEALGLLDSVVPDVITLDLAMPGMGGLACLDQIMVRRPSPVVVFSSLAVGPDGTGSGEALDALALGAIDVIAKPGGAISLEIETIAPDLIARVRAAALMRLPQTLRLRDRVRARAQAGGTLLHPQHRAVVTDPRDEALRDPDSVPTSARGEGVVLVGCSTGGPPALDVLLADLPADFPWPIVVAQHMPAAFTGPLAERLDRVCALRVCEVARTTALRAGHVYIGRGNADLLLSRRSRAIVAMTVPASPAHLWHPSVDRLVESALRVVPAHSLTGVLMTGMGTDGAAAMTRLKEHGGFTVAESAETAAIWGMPGALVEQGGASCIRPLEQIGPTLLARIAP